LLGNFLVLLAVIPEALFTILSKSVGKKITEMEAVILVNLFNLILFIPFAIYAMIDFRPKNISAHVYSQLLIYGISGGIMFFLLWYRGLTKINANTAALFTGVMPVSTTLLAFIFLNEPISNSEIIGMLLVIAAIFVGCKKHFFFTNTSRKTL
jgi:drug/metabolite transporter (DMT)-like permease